MVRDLEERAFNAWPALQTMLCDGWIFRFADGYTRRANSVNAWSPTGRFTAVFDAAHAVYGLRDLPLIVRLSPLAGADADRDLADRGFLVADETLVMRTSIAAEVRSDPEVALAPSPDQAWSEAFAAFTGLSPEQRTIHERMLANIRLPTCYAAITHRGDIAALGLAVLERGMVGLFDIVTKSSQRRRGLARRLTATLLDWGRGHDATGAYLQVTSTNRAARSLYDDLGFVEAYRYHYRLPPPAPRR